MNINFRAGYGNYQLSKPKQKEVTTEDTQLTNENTANGPENETVIISTLYWTMTIVDGTNTRYIPMSSTGMTILESITHDSTISYQAAQALKVNTMNFRQI